MTSRMLKLRREDNCCVCNVRLAQGAQAWWDAPALRVVCEPCWRLIAQPPGTAGPVPELDRGHAGASVAREHQRRKRNREDRTRRAHPHIGGLLLALRGAPKHEASFRIGQSGEERLAAWLERTTAGRPAILLHDRRMPGGRGNIDHLAIVPCGVFVIDAKNVKGKVRISDPMFGNAKLKISGYDRTKFIDGLDRQTAAVRNVLAANGHEDVAVTGVLCFLRADLPLFGAQKLRGHLLLSRRALGRRVKRDGALDGASIEELAATLARALPSA